MGSFEEVLECILCVRWGAEFSEVHGLLRIGLGHGSGFALYEGPKHIVVAEGVYVLYHAAVSVRHVGRQENVVELFVGATAGGVPGHRGGLVFVCVSGGGYAVCL